MSTAVVYSKAEPTKSTITDEPHPGFPNARVRYSENTAASTPESETVDFNDIDIDLNVANTHQTITGSVRFTFSGHTYVDREGSLYKDVNPTTNSGVLSGTLDYATGLAHLTAFDSGPYSVNLQGLVTSRAVEAVPAVYFRVPGSPLAVGQFIVRATTLNGELITGTANNNGLVSGTWMRGQIDWESGSAYLEFGSKVADASLPASFKSAPWYRAEDVGGDGKIWVPLLVDPNTIKYDVVVVSFVPLDGDILGVDTVRLPIDGRVPIFRTGNVVVVHNTQLKTFPNPVSSGQVIDLERTRLAYVVIRDANGVLVPDSKYSLDLNAGTITMAPALSLTGFVQPLVAEHRIEDMLLCTDVQITGELAFQRPLSHDFSAGDTYVSSAVLMGDLQARVEKVFAQETWTNVWQDSVIGSRPLASYNDVLYPIVVQNNGCTQDRWALIFTSSTTFQIVGEETGVVGTGSTNADVSPLNPSTNTPYFTLDHLGFGAAWATGNLLRFNTVAANYPLWFARTTLQGPVQEPTDHFKTQIRGDRDT